MIPRKTVRHEQVSRIQGLFQLDNKVFLGVLSATESKDFERFKCVSQRPTLIPSTPYSRTGSREGEGQTFKNLE